MLFRSVATGYSVFVESTQFNNSTYNINNAVTGLSGGTLISAATIGTEQYGVTINAGSTTTAVTISTTPDFTAGINSVNYTQLTPIKIVNSLGANSPAATGDTINTVLINHNLTVSQSTESGFYTQNIIYTVVPNL